MFCSIWFVVVSIISKNKTFSIWIIISKSSILKSKTLFIKTSFMILRIFRVFSTRFEIENKKRVDIFDWRIIEKNDKYTKILRILDENTRLNDFKCCIFDETIEFSTIVDDVSKIDDVSNIDDVNIDRDVVLRNRLNKYEINEILNRREFFKNESSDEKTNTTNFDSFINIKLKKIENSFFLSKREFFFSIVFCCLFTQIL